MKGLAQFLSFDFNAFSQGKQYVVTGVSEYVDYNTKAHLGTKVECAIAQDKTPYEFKDGKPFTNRYERITFKVNKDVNVPLEAHVMPKGVNAKVYGNFMEKLSVKCDDIVIVPAQTTTTTASSAPIKRPTPAQAAVQPNA